MVYVALASFAEMRFPEGREGARNSVPIMALTWGVVL